MCILGRICLLCRAVTPPARGRLLEMGVHRVAKWWPIGGVPVAAVTLMVGVGAARMGCGAGRRHRNRNGAIVVANAGWTLRGMWDWVILGVAGMRAAGGTAMARMVMILVIPMMTAAEGAAEGSAIGDSATVGAAAAHGVIATAKDRGDVDRVPLVALCPVEEGMGAVLYPESEMVINVSRGEVVVAVVDAIVGDGPMTMADTAAMVGVAVG